MERQAKTDFLTIAGLFFLFGAIVGYFLSWNITALSEMSTTIASVVVAAGVLVTMKQFFAWKQEKGIKSLVELTELMPEPARLMQQRLEAGDLHGGDASEDALALDDLLFHYDNLFRLHRAGYLGDEDLESIALPCLLAFRHEAVKQHLLARDRAAATHGVHVVPYRWFREGGLQLEAAYGKRKPAA